MGIIHPGSEVQKKWTDEQSKIIKDYRAKRIDLKTARQRTKELANKIALFILSEIPTIQSKIKNDEYYHPDRNSFIYYKKKLVGNHIKEIISMIDCLNPDWFLFEEFKFKQYIYTELFNELLKIAEPFNKKKGDSNFCAKVKFLDKVFAMKKSVKIMDRPWYFIGESGVIKGFLFNTKFGKIGIAILKYPDNRIRGYYMYVQVKDFGKGGR